jgi:hypothetical protein
MECPTHEYRVLHHSDNVGKIAIEKSIDLSSYWVESMYEVLTIAFVSTFLDSSY